MLMIWSSRARNRSFDPVVLCFFGRIVPSDATQNHARRFEGILKMKLQASGAPDPKSLQSKNPFPRKTESPIKVLQVLHGRLFIRHIFVRHIGGFTPSAPITTAAASEPSFFMTMKTWRPTAS